MKYSNYYIKMMVASVLFGAISILSFCNYHSATSVVFATLSFLFWYGAIMAPNHEKYREQ